MAMHAMLLFSDKTTTTMINRTGYPKLFYHLVMPLKKFNDWCKYFIIAICDDSCCNAMLTGKTAYSALKKNYATFKAAKTPHLDDYVYQVGHMIFKPEDCAVNQLFSRKALHQCSLNHIYPTPNVYVDKQCRKAMRAIPVSMTHYNIGF